MIKKETFNKLYEDALDQAEQDKKMYGESEEIEVILVPVVIRKNKSNGKIGCVSGVNCGLIFREEN